MTTVTIYATLRGTFWWPTGEEWTKPVDATFIVDRDPVHPMNHTSTIREAVDRICNDGDSQAAPLLSPDGIVEIARHNGLRTTIRRFPLTAFHSVEDYIDA